MIVVERSVLVEYSATQMRGLVEDVAAYPHFLPWCSGAGVVPIQPGLVEASIEINFRGIRQSFTTRNTMDLSASVQRIHMNLVNGPFKSLSGDWQFLPLSSDACKVILALQYEFSSRLLEKAIGPVFRHITDTLVDAFVQRARSSFPPGAQS
jgi:ribosome-associated toxin RatA of RatAB toxin-antitoxin module